MGVVVAVYPVAGGHSTGAARVAQYLPSPSGGLGDMVYRIGWGVQDPMYSLFNAFCASAPIVNRNGVDVVNIVHNQLAAHFVTLLAQPSSRGALRSIVTRCFKPGTIIYLIVTSTVLTDLLTRGANYQQAFQTAHAAHAAIRISDGGRRVLDVNPH